MAENMDSNSGNASEGKRRILPLKTLLMLVGVFVIEAVAITAMFFLFSPDNVEATDEASIKAAMGEKGLEIPVVNDRFASARSGRTYLYETEVVIGTRNKHKEHVEKALKEREAQIRADIAEIFRAAEPAHLHETSLATIKRQIEAKLNEHLGRSEQDEPFIDEIIIPRCTEYRADI